MPKPPFISNLLALPVLLARVVRDVVIQKQFIKKHIQPVLQHYKSKNDGSISDTDFLKITKYYGFGTVAILGENVATLRGEKLNFNERWASTCQGAITGLFDDFFDEKQLPQETLLQFIEQPETVTPSDMQEEMFLHFYTECLNGAYNRNLIVKYAKKVNQDQINSLLQTKPETGFDEILKITFDKGGNSVLFYRALFSPNMMQAEVDATYEMGALMQLGNDIFDVYKDARDGIRTVMTIGLPMREVRKIFLRQMNRAFQMYAHLPFHDAAKRRVLHKISFGISRVFVALDQFEKLEQKSGRNFQPTSYKRKELICDMEKPVNLWRSVKYYVRYPLPR